MDYKVVVAIPSGDIMKTRTAMCLVSMFVYCNNQLPGATSQLMTLHNKKGSTLSQLRQDLVSMALEHEASHVLFVDSDQTFPPDTLHQLMAHKVPVIAANIATKSFPPYPTARIKSEVPGGEPVYSFPHVHGKERVWRVGMGIMLVATWVFKHLEKPYFNVTWRKELEDFQGEDWHFCELLEKAGIDIWIDHDLSREVGHLGETEFSHTMVTTSMMAKGQVTQEDLNKSTLQRSL